jgi:hypothetical protein
MAPFVSEPLMTTMTPTTSETRNPLFHESFTIPVKDAAKSQLEVSCLTRARPSDGRNCKTSSEGMRV